MGIQVNNNITSLLIQQNLNRVTNDMETALERLSSGKRINRAADDNVGMSVSKRLQNQIRGYQQNIQNVNNGLSVTSIAESALSQLSNTASRMRELAVQAANDTLGPQQRQLIQAEINQLIEEINRLASTTEFNGKNLLDGSYGNARVMTGIKSGQFLVVDIPDVQSNVLGAHADVSSDITTELLPIIAADLLVNGIEVPPTIDDGFSSANGDGSALAKVNAINSISGQSGVKAEVVPTTVTGVAAIGNGSLDGTTSSLSINGVNIGAVDFNGNNQGAALVNKINEFSNETGVVATVDASDQLVLTAEDGRNIQVVTTGNVGDEIGLIASNGDVNSVTAGGIRLLATETISVSGNLNRIGFSAGLATTAIDLNTAINSIDVTTQETANEALRRIDFALNEILETRTQLGAVQNRLENASENLALTVENISAANSEIVDADFAEETAILTQSQILQEAGLAVLAQSNSIPQTAISLLLLNR